MPQRHRLPWWVALAALLLTLGACAPEAIDPLALPTPFSFEVDNPEEIEGPVYGAMIVPFETNPMFSVGTKAEASPNLDAFINAMIDAEIDAAGLVEGSFISVHDVPRINEAFGVEFGWWLFFPPEECPVTATNPLEAALAPILAMVVWDGETLVDGVPDIDGMIRLESYERVDGEGGAYTATNVTYVPVASRAAWSATTDGACEPEGWGGDSFLSDLSIEAGWQFLRYTSVETYDGMDWTYAEEVVSLTLDEVAASGVIGEIEPPDGLMPASLQPGLGRLPLFFR